MQGDEVYDLADRLLVDGQLVVLEEGLSGHLGVFATVVGQLQVRSAALGRDRENKVVQLALVLNLLR